MEFWSFWVKNLRLIGWGGRSNTDAHAPEIMRELLDLAETGRLRPVVGGTYPFAEAADAHAAIEARHAHWERLYWCRSAECHVASTQTEQPEQDGPSSCPVSGVSPDFSKL